ncbi:MAG: hypothetical protein LC660_08620 [Desulfobacteraceae bacterium]|nr:hypothetical protein [Desulfobacteraceae bacterium]
MTTVEINAGILRPCKYAPNWLCPRMHPSVSKNKKEASLPMMNHLPGGAA